MTKIVTATQARSDIYNLINETALSHEPIIITGKKANAVMMSQEDYNAIAETLYLSSIPNMANSIQEAMRALDSEFSEDVEW
jgi:PHD/YefM family antitoxin component YafN of YafNO toxin-antitoxin module